MRTQDRFPEVYDTSTPAWDIGCSQPDLLAAFDALSLTGSVLDVGCGDGYEEVFVRPASFSTTPDHESLPAWLSLFIRGRSGEQ